MDKYNNNFANKYSDKIKLNRKNLSNNKNKSSSNKSDEDYTSNPMPKPINFL